MMTPFTQLAAIYARVSTQSQEEEGTIRTQITALQQFARENGYLIVQEYIDEAWSGDILARPALDTLRQDAKKKIWNTILIYDPDRLARRYSYQELIMDELREAGIEVRFITVSTPKNSEDKILYGVRGLFAEYERVKIAERFRLGKLRKLKEGHIMVSVPLYGYDYVCKQQGEDNAKSIPGYYLINNSEARVVRMIFDWIDQESLSLREVVRRLQDMNIRPRRSKRGVWSTGTLTTMLRNRAYIGEARWGSSEAIVPLKPKKQEIYRKKKKTSRRIKPESEWYTVTVPAIIEEQQFLRVRTRLAENYAKSTRNTKNEYLLSGKIWCSCGIRRHGEGALHGKYLYYRCSQRMYSFPLPPTCKEKGLNAHLTDQYVWEGIQGLMTSQKLIRQYVNSEVNLEPEQHQHSTAEVTELEKQIQELQVQQQRYYEGFGQGVISMEKLKELTEAVSKKIDFLKRQLVIPVAKSTTPYVPTEEEIDWFVKDTIKNLENLNFEGKKAIIQSVISKITGNRSSLTISGNIPVCSNVSLYSKDRNGLNTIQHTGIPFSFVINLEQKNEVAGVNGAQISSISRDSRSNPFINP